MNLVIYICGFVVGPGHGELGHWECLLMWTSGLSFVEYMFRSVIPVCQVVSGWGLGLGLEVIQSRCGKSVTVLV